MRKLFALGPCLLAILLAFSPASADTLTVASDPWCPYNCASDSEKPGYMIEVLQVIFAKAGHQIQYENMPWSRCIDHLQKGKIDAVVGATKGEAQECVFPAEEFGFSNTCFFVKKGNIWSYTNLESLTDLKIGIQTDYEYGAALDEYFAKNLNTPNVQAVSSDEPLVSNIRKLVKDRIDTVPEDKAVFLYTAREIGVADQVQLAGKLPVLSAEDFESSMVFVAFAPGKAASETYAQLFTAGIKEMRDSGALEEILAKYGLSDWKPDLMEIKAKLGL